MSGRANVRRILAALLLLVSAASRPAGAADAAGPSDSPSAELRVGTYLAPPFVMKDAGGEWSGLAIDLWREMARRQGLAYRLQEYDLAGLLHGLETGSVDVAVGPLLITAERARVMDLTSPFMHVALAIGTRPDAGWTSSLMSVFSGPLFWATMGLAVLLLVFALIVWLLERHRNPQHFGGSPMRGMGDAIWWSASTMSTVGYGDRTPVTFWGRTVGIVWMFSSILLVSAFIALFSSALTVRQLRARIESIHDLAHARVGVVAASGAAEYLHDVGIAALRYDDVDAAVDALVAGRLDAVFGDSTVLKFLAEHRTNGQMVVIPQPFTQGFVAFAVPLDSHRRRAFSISLLEVLDDPGWEEITRKYLGQ